MNDWLQKYPEVTTGSPALAPTAQPDQQAPAATSTAVYPGAASSPAPASWLDKYPEVGSAKQPAAPATGGNWLDRYPEISTGSAALAQKPPVAADPPKPQRSVLGETGHQLGLAARMGVNMVAALPAMAADAVAAPINMGLDAVAGRGNGFRFPNQGQALNQVMDQAGVAQPENKLERVVQDIGAGMGGAATGVGIGTALAKTAGPIAKATSAMLTENAGLQVVSGATSGAAMGMTREAGGGEGAQFAASLAGAALPGVVGAPTRRVPVQNRSQFANAAQEAHAAGFVIPPSDLGEGAITGLASAISGKTRTAQEASSRNQSVVNDLVRKELRLTPDQDLSIETLAGIRQQAAKSYDVVAGAGAVTPTAAYGKALDDAVSTFRSQATSFPGMKSPQVIADIEALRSPQFDAGDALNTVRVLRNAADTAYRAGDNLVGKSYRKGAAALEDALETHLETIGAPAADVLQSFRDARQTIAKTYSVQKALNSQTGDVNAQKLASDLSRNKPLSGELRTVAEAAQAFPKALQSLKEQPSKNSVFDAGTALGLAAITGNPAYAGLMAARPLARQWVLSKGQQEKAARNAGTELIAEPNGAAAIAINTAARTPTGDGRENDRPMNRIQAGKLARETGGTVEKVAGGFIVRPLATTAP